MCPEYRYRAVDWSGRKCRGRFHALNRQELLEQLQAQGLTAVDIRQVKGLLRPGTGFTRLLEQLRYGKAGSRDFMFFCSQFGIMLRAGVNAHHALHVLASQAENTALRRRLEEANLSIGRGYSIAAALSRQADFFPEILIRLIEAGEAGGVLGATLERLAEHFERQHDLEEKMRAAALYPAFISVVASVVLAVMVVVVLPQFERIFSSINLELPLYTALLLRGSAWLRQWWFLPAALLLLLYTALRRGAATNKGRLLVEWIRLRLPLFGTLYLHTLLARFTRITGILLGGGLGLIDALELAGRAMENRVLAGAISRASEAVAQGKPLAGQLRAAGLFPPVMVESIRVGEMGGELEVTFNHLAAYFERDISFRAARLGSLLEPLLLLLVGMFTGIIVFSIISPMYQVFRMM